MTPNDNRFSGKNAEIIAKNKKFAIIAKRLSLILYGPIFPLWPSVPSTALSPLHGPMSLLRLYVPSTALCPLWKERNKRNGPLVSRNVLQNAFRQYSKGYCDLFRLCDNRDYRDNHDYHSSEILSDNREIAIITLEKKVAKIAIITSNKKR